MRLSAGLIACLSLLACNSAAGNDGGAGSSESGAPSESESDGSDSLGTETGTETETGDTNEPPENLLLSGQRLNIAHRGGGKLRPEATLPAFENALAVGADVIEFDLHASADGVVVVIHDDTW